MSIDDSLHVYEVCLPQGFCADYLGHSAWSTCPIEAVHRVMVLALEEFK